jgi:outer membrane protein W
MKNVVTIAFAAALACALPSNAHAQAQQGDREVQVSGNMTSLLRGGGQNTTGQITFGVGYYVTDRLEVGVAPLITVSSSSLAGGGGTSVTADAGVSTSLQYALGAKSSRVKPYLGASYVINSFKTDGGSLADNTFAAAIAGVKSYMTPKAALDFQSSFGFRPNAPSAEQRFGFNVGITYLF